MIDSCHSHCGPRADLLLHCQTVPVSMLGHSSSWAINEVQWWWGICQSLGTVGSGPWPAAWRWHCNLLRPSSMFHGQSGSSLSLQVHRYPVTVAGRLGLTVLLTHSSPQLSGCWLRFGNTYIMLPKIYQNLWQTFFCLAACRAFFCWVRVCKIVQINSSTQRCCSPAKLAGSACKVTYDKTDRLCTNGLKQFFPFHYSSAGQAGTEKSRILILDVVTEHQTINQHLGANS